MEAYFVPRGELLKWLNEFFDLQYSKVEQCANGALHCQIMDAIYPGKVPLSKVNFNAKLEYEFIKNYKVLQSVFEAQKVDKYIDVDKLIKGKYQDNLEFLQWMKKYFDTHHNPSIEYNAAERRKQAGQKGGVGTVAPASKSISSKPAAKPKASDKPAPVSESDKIRDRKPLSVAALKEQGAEDLKKNNSQALNNAKDGIAAELVAANMKIKELREELNEKVLHIEELDNERNFYFQKLRDVEVLIQNIEIDGSGGPDSDVIQRIQTILYATEEETLGHPKDDDQEELEPTTNGYAHEEQSDS